MRLKFIFMVGWMFLALAARQEFRTKPITAGEKNEFDF